MAGINFGLGFSSYGDYTTAYSNGYGASASAFSSAQNNGATQGNAATSVGGVSPSAGSSPVNGVGEAELSPAAEKAKKRSGAIKCETCAERKYQDESDEANVSFKNASHVDPAAAGSAVRAHEGMHVSNAYKKAAEGNGKVLQASVSIHTAVCPECGRTYVSGGTTHTKIAYGNEDNKYQQARKQQDSKLLPGMNFDAAV